MPGWHESDTEEASTERLCRHQRLAGHFVGLGQAHEGQQRGIRTYVQGLVAGSLFSALVPYDVNYPSVYGPNRLGGRLNSYVNIPSEWKNPASGYLDGIRIEALDFGAGTRSLDLAAMAVQLAIGWGWALADIGYFYPVFNGGCPWQYEQQLAQAAGIASLVPWAVDHCCLFGWDLRKKLIPGAAVE